MRAPCKDCADRKVGCHSVCSRYLAWREEHEAEKRERKRYQDANSYVITSIQKTRKKRR